LSGELDFIRRYEEWRVLSVLRGFGLNESILATFLKGLDVKPCGWANGGRNLFNTIRERVFSYMDETCTFKIDDKLLPGFAKRLVSGLALQIVDATWVVDCSLLCNSRGVAIIRRWWVFPSGKPVFNAWDLGRDIGVRCKQLLHLWIVP